MDLWSVRNQALEEIEGELQPEKEALEDEFALMDKCIERLFSDAKDGNERFALVCLHTLVKARRYALGCYSICLDGLHVEGGALFRPLIETWEQLAFYQQEPESIEFALENKLPSAGEIGKKIQSQLKGLRDYLNTHASHFTFEPDSLQPMAMYYDRESLRTSIRVLNSVTHLTTVEAAKCLSVINQLDQSLIDDIESARQKGIRVFRMDELLEVE